MSIRNAQVDLTHPTSAQVLQEATPAVFVFLRASTEGQHFSPALQIHAQRREDHGGIGLRPMPHREMDQRPAGS